MKSWEGLKARDLMNSPVLTVEEDVPLGEAARRMAENQVSGLLVTDQSGQGVGVISLSDIVAYLAGLERAMGEPGGFYRLGQPKFEEAEEAEEAEVKEIEEAGDAEEEPLWKTTVDELMAEEILSVPLEASVAEVARVLRERRIHRVFVSGPDGPEGVISSMDLLGVLAEIPMASSGT